MTTNTRRFLALPFLATLGLLTESIQAASIKFDPTGVYVTGIAGLEILGPHYEVTFNLDASFNDLFDPNADRDLDTRPVFLFDTSDPAGAIAAATAISDALGIDKQTAPDPYVHDQFLIPYSWSYNPSDAYTYIRAIIDTVGALSVDVVDGGGFAFFSNRSYEDLPIVTFKEVSPVPIPATAWLLASALGIFGYLGRRKAGA